MVRAAGLYHSSTVDRTLVAQGDSRNTLLPTARTRCVVALRSVTFSGRPNCAVLLRTRVSGGAEQAHTVSAVKPLGGTSVVQTSSLMVSMPEASRLRRCRPQHHWAPMLLRVQKRLDRQARLGQLGARWCSSQGLLHHGIGVS